MQAETGEREAICCLVIPLFNCLQRKVERINPINDPLNCLSIDSIRMPLDYHGYVNYDSYGNAQIKEACLELKEISHFCLNEEESSEVVDKK